MSRFTAIIILCLFLVLSSVGQLSANPFGSTLVAARPAADIARFRYGDGIADPLKKLADLSEFGDSFHYVQFQDGKFAVVAATDGYSDTVHEQLLILDKSGEMLGSTPLEGNDYYPTSLVVSETGLVAVKSSTADSQVIEIFDSSDGSPEQIVTVDGERRTITAFSTFEDVLVVKKRIDAEMPDRSMPTIMRTTEYIDIRTGENTTSCSAS